MVGDAVGFLERFWRRVDDRGGPNACWPWRGWINDGGYGIVAMGGKLSRAIHIRAHRLAYELHHREPIPAELTIDHLCRVRHCVNPAHLDVVTKGVNVRRGETTAARHAEVMVCPYGHPYDQDNTEWKADGSRGCRICRRRRSREWWRRNRAHAPPRHSRRRVLDGPRRGGPTAMRTVGGILGGLLRGAQVVTAATWTCTGGTTIVTAQAYLVPTLCKATGTYTTGGDLLGSGPGAELCNSAAKKAVFALATTAASATTGQGYVVWYLPAGKIMLGTAGNSPGAGVALVELAAGTAIDGATVVMLSFCH